MRCGNAFWNVRLRAGRWTVSSSNPHSIFAQRPIDSTLFFSPGLWEPSMTGRIVKNELSNWNWTKKKLPGREGSYGPSEPIPNRMTSAKRMVKSMREHVGCQLDLAAYVLMVSMAGTLSSSLPSSSSSWSSSSVRFLFIFKVFTSSSHVILIARLSQ